MKAAVVCFLSVLLLSLAGCRALCFNCISIPELNPHECGCDDGATRLKITIDNGAVLCIGPDSGSLGGDIWPVCRSDKNVKDTGCKVVEEGSSFEKVVCP